MTLGTLLALGRVSNLPTVWTNVLAAGVLAGAAPAPVRFAVVALAMSLFYCGGMFLNDAFDREVDARERPERPIPSGRAEVSSVFALGAAQLVAGILLLVLVAGQNSGYLRAVAAGTALAFCITAYDASHKNHPVAPWVMGLCRALVYVGAAVALTAAPRWTELLVGAATLAVYTVGVTQIASVEASGRASRVRPVAYFAIAPLALVAVGGMHAVMPVVALIAWGNYALARAFRADMPDVPGAVVRAIAGMCLLDAAWLWITGARGLAMVAVLGLPLTRLAQRRVAGT